MKKGISKLENGCYQYRIKRGKIDIVKRKDENGNPFKTQKAAELARSKKLIELEEQIDNNFKKMKVADIYYKYIATDKEKEAATLRKKESMWNNHIEEIFGNRYIDEIELIELELFLKELYYEKNYSYSYVTGFLKFFYLIWGTAFKCNAITENQYNKFIENKSTKLKMPTKKQIDVEEDAKGANIYTELEIEKFYSVFKDSDLEIAFLLAYHCGLRIAEIFALTWDDVDFYNSKISIKKQLVYEKKMWCFKKVKTEKSIREIDINKDLKLKLAILLNKQEKQKQELKEAYRNTEKIKDKVSSTNEKILTNVKLINRKSNGEMLTPNSMKYYRKKIKELYDLEYKTHDMRHTHAQNLANANVSVYLLCQRMGHSKIDTSMQYYINSNKLATEFLLEELNKTKKVKVTKEEIEKLEKEEEKRNVLKQSIYI